MPDIFITYSSAQVPGIEFPSPEEMQDLKTGGMGGVGGQGGSGGSGEPNGSLGGDGNVGSAGVNGRYKSFTIRHIS